VIDVVFYVTAVRVQYICDVSLSVYQFMILCQSSVVLDRKHFTILWFIVNCHM